jgi:DNA repair protein RadC
MKMRKIKHENKTVPCNYCKGSGLLKIKGSEPASSPNAIFYMACKLMTQQTESFVIYAMDTKHRITHEITVTEGLLDGTLIHPREVFQNLIKVGAYCFVAVHNHPSGDSSPSPADLESTRSLLRAGKLLQIELVDHVIIGAHGYYSLRERENWLWSNNDVTVLN